MTLGIIHLVIFVLTIPSSVLGAGFARLGLVMCYLPGLAFGLFATFTVYFVLERDQRPIEAIRSSFGVVKANFDNALVSVLLGGLVAGAGAIVCLVGLLVTAPVAMLVHVYTFRILGGGSVAP